MAKVTKCPICSSSVSGMVCEKCGWLRLVFPATVPESLESFISHYTETLASINRASSEGERVRVSLENELQKERFKAQSLQAQLDAERLAFENEKLRFRTGLGAGTVPLQREPKGSIVLTVGGKKHISTLYAGDNSIVAPEGMGFCGDLFHIVESNGVYKIYDVCGQLKKANGKSVNVHGEDVSNGLVFTVANARVDLVLPEVDLDSII